MNIRVLEAETILSHLNSAEVGFLWFEDNSLKNRKLRSESPI